MDYLPVRAWVRRRRRLTEDIALVPIAENASLTTGYCISARGARFLLAAATPMAGLADWPCDTIPLGALVTSPRIVTHPPITASTSAIEAERVLLDARRPPATGRLKRFLRKAYWQRWWVKRFATRLP